MKVAVGSILIVLGILLVVLGVLAWLGIVTPVERGATPWDFLIVLLDRAPWIVVVGLIFIFLGLTMLGMKLPFK